MNFELDKEYVVTVTDKGIVPIDEFNEERFYDKDNDDLDFLTDEEKMVVINDVLDKIRSEITDCLKALDDIEKSGLNIYLPNEMSGRRVAYQQCLKFIDKYKTESER